MCPGMVGVCGVEALDIIEISSSLVANIEEFSKQSSKKNDYGFRFVERVVLPLSMIKLNVGKWGKYYHQGLLGSDQAQHQAPRA